MDISLPQIPLQHLGLQAIPTFTPNLTGSVTFKPHGELPANLISSSQVIHGDNINDALKQSRNPDNDYVVIQSSFTRTKPPEQVIASRNGLVNSIIRAFSGHHHLVIRPDDLWIAILTQFSLYVNAHAEELRGKFVSHAGQKELVIEYETANRFTFPWDRFATDMADLLHVNLADPSLKDWVVPEFSTTKPHDRVVASIVMMGTLQKYFTFTGGIACGFPSVTLLGDKKDYELILSRLEKLTEYGDEPTAFAKLLRPVLRRFVLSFEQPDSDEVHYFWRRAFSRDDSTSGVTQYAGWISAFCFWDEDGRSLAGRLYGSEEDYFNDDGTFGEMVEEKPWGSESWTKEFALAFGREDVPPAWTKVPVKIIGDGPDPEAEITAGLMGTELSRSGDLSAEGAEGEGMDTLQPMAMWFVHEIPTPSEAFLEAQRIEAEHLEQLMEYIEAKGLKWEEE